MVNWTILAAVKILKLAVFGAMSMVSFVADIGGCTAEQTACTDTTTVTAVAFHPAGAPWSAGAPVVVRSADSVSASVDVASVDEAIRVAERLERIGRLAPPVRVEIIFTPDLLTPPTRDPSL